MSNLPRMKEYPLAPIDPEWRGLCMAITSAGQRCKSKGTRNATGWVHCGRKGHDVRQVVPRLELDENGAGQ